LFLGYSYSLVFSVVTPKSEFLVIFLESSNIWFWIANYFDLVLLCLTKCKIQLHCKRRPIILDFFCIVVEMLFWVCAKLWTIVLGFCIVVEMLFRLSAKLRTTVLGFVRLTICLIGGIRTC